MSLFYSLLLSFSFLLMHSHTVFDLDFTNDLEIGTTDLAAGEQKIDPESFDFELLESILLNSIEKRRPKMNTTNLNVTEVLKNTSTDLLNQFSFGSIKYAMRKNKLSQRKWTRIIDHSDFNGTYKAIAIATAPLYDYPNNAKVYHNKSDVDHPFYFKQWKKEVPLSTHTYNSLVDHLLKNAAFSDNRKILKSKALSELGYAFRLEERGAGKMPYISVAIVAGGYRLQRLSDMVNDN